MTPELEAEIQHSIEELSSLLNGAGAVVKLISYGQAALPALAQISARGLADQYLSTPVLGCRSAGRPENTRAWINTSLIR
jgi:hypothetical protein